MLVSPTLIQHRGDVSFQSQCGVEEQRGRASMYETRDERSNVWVTASQAIEIGMRDGSCLAFVGLKKVWGKSKDFIWVGTS